MIGTDVYGTGRRDMRAVLKIRSEVKIVYPEMIIDRDGICKFA